MHGQPENNTSSFQLEGHKNDSTMTALTRQQRMQCSLVMLPDFSECTVPVHDKHHAMAMQSKQLIVAANPYHVFNSGCSSENEAPLKVWPLCSIA